MSNSLDPDQAGQNDRPDLGPSCLQKLELEDTRRQGVNHLCQINSSTDIVFDKVSYCDRSSSVVCRCPSIRRLLLT